MDAGEFAGDFFVERSGFFIGWRRIRRRLDEVLPERKPVHRRSVIHRVGPTECRGKGGREGREGGGEKVEEEEKEEEEEEEKEKEEEKEDIISG